MNAQNTISNSVEFSGIGVHSGEKTVVAIKPAPVDTGVIFRRIDLNPIVEIPASYQYVCDTMLCTAVGIDKVKIATVEHLLSALAAFGIDNAYIDVNKSEIPIMDGSARPFADILMQTGITAQEKPKKFLKILKPVAVEHNGKSASLKPYDGYKISISIDFAHPAFKNIPKDISFDFTRQLYIDEISRARTFGFLAEYEMLKSRNLAKGGSLENTIVLDDAKILNADGLRFDTELVMHKALDAIGDLYLIGSPLIGSFEGIRSGHELNNKLVRALMQQPESFEYI